MAVEDDIVGDDLDADCNDFVGDDLVAGEDFEAFEVLEAGDEFETDITIRLLRSQVAVNMECSGGIVSSF